MENEEKSNEVITKLNGKQLGVEIGKIVTLFISFLMLVLFLFAPCLELDIQQGREREQNYLTENIAQDEELMAKYLKALINDTQNNDITVYDILNEIDSNYREEGNKDPEVGIGFFNFSLFTWKYTVLNGKGRIVLTSGLTQFGSHFFIAVALAGCMMAILMLVALLLRIINLKMNSPKIKSSLTSKFLAFHSGHGLIAYVGLVIPFLLATIPAVFAWHPIYSTYLMYFTFTPLFYTILAIEGVMLIAHFVLKSFSRKVY